MDAINEFIITAHLQVDLAVAGVEQHQSGRGEPGIRFCPQQNHDRQRAGRG